MIFPLLAPAPEPSGGPTQIRTPFRTLYLPNVWGPPLVTPPEKARQLYELMANDPKQKRALLLWNARLAEAAQDKAEALLAEQVFDHTVGGRTPNEMLRDYGFILPPFYPRVGNSVESLVTNTDDPVTAWSCLKASPPHRDHVLGLGPFFSKQTVVAVGWHVIPSTGQEYRDMIVILTLHP